MTHFYLTLPSNSSMKYYPNNTLTQYTTRLQTPIELSGEWEVALVEMMFTKTWYTIPKHSGKFTFSCLNCDDYMYKAIGPGYKPSDYYVNMTVQCGYYTSMQDLVNAMNEAVEDGLKNHSFPVIDQNGQRHLTKIEGDKWPRFSYNETKKKVNVYLQPGAAMSFDEYVGSILGMNTSILINRHTVARMVGGTMASDIDGGVHGLYVYCDILENVPVGDTEAPLLRVVDSTAKNGEHVTRTFDPLRYVPIQKKHFDSIEILLKDDHGDPVAFEGGKLMITLHFRRATSQYFSS